ncbi:Molybdopterin-binding protein [Halogranum amylolyticum]|uniref:Molybdopterin-binding protein n=1 Tax=Halogranum amylolyticum TaxID=660520 RepID=A0A1H8RUU9_9EURY|nr:Molybdopterin-binding protein [Halogranum amylolyticum]
MSTESHNRLRSIVRSVVHTGSVVHVVLEGPDGELFTTLLTAAAVDRLDLGPGDELEATMQVAEVAVDGRRAQPVRRHVPARTLHGGVELSRAAV